MMLHHHRQISVLVAAKRSSHHAVSTLSAVRRSSTTLAFATTPPTNNPPAAAAAAAAGRRRILHHHHHKAWCGRTAVSSSSLDAERTRQKQQPITSLVTPSSPDANQQQLQKPQQPPDETTTEATAAATTTTPSPSAEIADHQKSNNHDDDNDLIRLINLSTITESELHDLIVTCWGYPKYRSKQVYHWIRKKGVTNVDDMNNIPKDLRQMLKTYSQPNSLQLQLEQISNDGTIKRAYKCQNDGQIIESVLMPYDDGRYTACISSQAGCAQGCVFCATGQMGFARQLSANEIFEQVARFAAELQQQQDNDVKKSSASAAASVASSSSTNNVKSSSSSSSSSKHNKQQQQYGRGRKTNKKRLSNIVFMGMGEPLANYKNVVQAVNRIINELGIGAGRITISTVGIVKNIRKMMNDPQMPNYVRLAVSLHCANDEERSELLPANRRNGGLSELMDTLAEYIDTTGKRITLEWALIAGENDNVETAKQLGQLVDRYGLRRDLVHVNVIPLNPTNKYSGRPSQKRNVDLFCNTLQREFGISCTPRVRRGIDIDAGCGQLKSAVLKEDQNNNNNNNNDASSSSSTSTPGIDDDKLEDTESSSSFSIDKSAIDIDRDDYDDPVYGQSSTIEEQQEADRLISLVQGTAVSNMGNNLGDNDYNSLKKQMKKKTKNRHDIVSKR